MAQVNLGRIGFVNKGSWNIATNYKLNDVVRYGGSTYAAKRPNVGITPPTNGTDTDDWFYFVDNSGDYVDKTSNQDITGIKNFIVSPKVPTPTTDTQAANKAYVDSASGSTAVKLTGNQTIAGIKTFSSNIVGNITGNASYATSAGSATNATNASYATSAGSATNATNASYATTQATSDNSTKIATTEFVKSLVAGSGGYTQSFSSNGWTKLPNGLIIQWGNCVEGINTLPTTFPNAFFSVNATFSSYVDTDSGNSIEIVNNSRFNYRLGAVGGDRACYIAVGY